MFSEHIEPAEIAAILGMVEISAVESAREYLRSLAVEMPEAVDGPRGLGCGSDYLEVPPGKHHHPPGMPLKACNQASCWVPHLIRTRPFEPGELRRIHV